MKKLLLFASLIFIINISNSQQSNKLEVKTYKLDNGLTVYLHEEHSKPEIFGAVVVNAGSKHDPQDATGIAHYFEHIMFKGTDKIGTIDWTNEKVYLDSIQFMYDSLYKTKDEKIRTLIQQHINELSIAAAQFAIPNETDIILKNIGGKNLNAYTSFEQTVYHNSFPSNQLEKWLTIYAERFRNPVFRLFQSELETVYEEKNMYSDDYFSSFFEKYLQAFFKQHPYRTPVIGTNEHLKNPRLSKMLEFYNTYYVANNMALVITGDFESDKIIELIKKHFGNWRSAKVPEYKIIEEKPFVGREFISKRLTPIKVGVLGFRGVPNKHKDELALELCMQVLSNEGETGLLDKLNSDNKVMQTMAQMMKLNDHGAIMIIIVPKIIGQSIKKAEKLVMEQIESLKKGDFDAQLLEALKLNYRKNIERKFENSDGIARLLIDAFIEKREWQEYLDESYEVDKITKEDIVRVANEYFNNNYIAYHSKTGFPKKDKIKKPDWKPVTPKNSEKKSNFALELDNITESTIVPKFVDFQKDINFSNIKEGVNLFYKENPINNIFTLKFKYKIGSYSNIKILQMSQFLNNIGTEEKNIQEFRKELQNIGASLSFMASSNNFTIYIDGYDNKFDETLKLVAQFMQNAKSDNKQLDKLIQNEKANYKSIKADPDSKNAVLLEYSMFKSNSEYLNKFSEKEIKKIKGEELIDLFKEILNYQCDVHYVGKLSVDNVKSSLLNNIKFSETPQQAIFIDREITEYQEPIIYILNDKKALQSKIYFWSLGETANEEEKAKITAFNKYFGSGMASIVFQEIREFRSLSYSAYAYYSNRILKQNKGYLMASISTQSDKTIEGVSVMLNLLKNMPIKEDRINGIKKELLQSIHTQNLNFRYITDVVSNWKFQGYEKDPREFQLSIHKDIKFNDILTIYDKFVKGRPVIITMVGDVSKFNIDELSKFGKIIKMDLKDIFKK